MIVHTQFNFEILLFLHCELDWQASSLTDETDMNVTSFIGSPTVLKSIFEALNKNIFNDALKGIDVKWMTFLKSRTALSVNIGTNFSSQTIIYVSNTLLSKCTRKQLIESILVKIVLFCFILSIRCEKLTNVHLFQYEMVLVYIWSKLTKSHISSSGERIDEDEKAQQLQALLKRAMDFINRKAGTTLSFNYPVHAHHTTQKFNEWIEIDADVHHQQFNNSIICISDDDSDDDDLESIRKMGCELIGSSKLKLQPIVDRKCSTITIDDTSICLCCTDYNKLFLDYFADINFDLNSIENGFSVGHAVECPLCCNMTERNSLNAHFDNVCSLFCVWAELIINYSILFFCFLYV